MNHLISDADRSRIESQLLLRRDQLVQATSWTLNLVLLVGVLASFGMFLYVQYTRTTQDVQETKRIPFAPVPWHSATRNVRSEEYGRPIAIEAGYGLSGTPLGGGPDSVY